MASLEEAYSTILMGNFPDKAASYPIVGVLIGRVVNATYYIYSDTSSKYFSEVNGSKISLNISHDDHGKEIEVPMVGYKYRINFFNSPKMYSS